jgi:hypothetical protein
LGASCALTNGLLAISPPIARAAIKLSFFISCCPLFVIGLFVARRFTRRRIDGSLHKDKTLGKEHGYSNPLYTVPNASLYPFG